MNARSFHVPIVIAGVILAFALPALAQSDPYGDAYRKSTASDYNKSRDIYLSNIRAIYFATACHVFPSENYAAPLINSMGQTIIALATDVYGFVDQDIDRLKRQSANQGTADAVQPGACDYWKQHLNEAVSLRKAAERAIMYQ